MDNWSFKSACWGCLLYAMLCILLLGGIWWKLKSGLFRDIGLHDELSAAKARKNCEEAIWLYFGTISVCLVTILIKFLMQRWSTIELPVCVAASSVGYQEIANADELVSPRKLHPVAEFTSKPRVLFQKEDSWLPASECTIRHCICVEGNIASGKSTLMTELNNLGWTVFEEPVTTRWKDCLNLLYSDQRRWGFSFQIEVFDWFRCVLQRLLEFDYVEPSTSLHSHILVERSPMAAYNVFSTYMHKAGFMHDQDFVLLKNIIRTFG